MHTYTSTNTVYCRLMRKYKINTHRCLRLARAYKIKTKMRWNLEEILCSVYRELWNALCISQKTDWFQSYHYCFFFFFSCVRQFWKLLQIICTHTHMCSLQNQIHTHTRAHMHLQVRTGMSVFGFQRWKFSFSPLPEKKAAALLCSASNYWEMSVIHNLLCLKKICFWYSNPSAPSAPAWSCVESVVACF